MIKTILIDDEKKCLQSLEQSLQESCPQIRILELCQSAKDGLKAIKRHQPDLIFLDIMMPWMNGFEMLELLDEINFEVIFTTAYDEFALQAFRLSAADFLLKPIALDELESAVNKVIDKHQHAFSKEHFDVLVENLKPQNLMQRIAFPVGDGFKFVPVQDIEYCLADGNYTMIFLTTGEKLCVVRRLKVIEGQLKGHNFCRIHNSHMINLNHTVKYFRGDGGYVTMASGIVLNVSRNRKDSLLNMIQA